MSWPQQLNVCLDRRVRRLVLVGPSGAGKTYWTKSLIRKRGWSFVSAGSFSEVLETVIPETGVRSLLDFSGKVITGPIEEVQKVIIEDGADSWTFEDHDKLSRFMDKNPSFIWIIHAWNLYANRFLKTIRTSKAWTIIQVPPYGIRMLQSIAPSVPEDLIVRAQGSAWAALRFANDIKSGGVESLRDSFYGPAQVFLLQDTPLITLSKIREHYIVKMLAHLNYVDMSNKFRMYRDFSALLSDADLFERRFVTGMSTELIVRGLYVHSKPMPRLNYWTPPRPIADDHSGASSAKYRSRAELDCPKGLKYRSMKMILEEQETSYDDVVSLRPSRKRKVLSSAKAPSKKPNGSSRSEVDDE